MIVRLVCLLCPIVLGLICFGPVLLKGQQFGFRDSADFYYPLYLRVQQEWQAGRLPLWEPEENGGMPLLGNPTAAVLYPGKFVFAVLDYAWAARIYVIAHVALAHVAMLLLLRGWGLSLLAASLGAMAYAFGGPVLYQYSNVIFLVGAAWMPLGFLAADRWIRHGTAPSLAALAAVLAMQTLGGDPEAAYITVISTFLYSVCFSMTESRFGSLQRWLVGLGPVLGLYLVVLAWSVITPVSAMNSVRPYQLDLAAILKVFWLLTALYVMLRYWKRRGWGLEARLLGLSGAAFLGLLISAIQVLPALEFISLSLRASTGPGIGTIYQFSTHPARLAEILWPGFFGGHSGGKNHLWLMALPPDRDHNVWVESLYLGGLTLLLALSGMIRCCKGPAWHLWLTLLTILGFLLAMGRYGSPGFWLQALSDSTTHPRTSHLLETSPWKVDGFASPYWFLKTVLPGFDAFRYPGKFLVLASLGFCALAAIGADDLLRHRGKQAFLWLSSLGCTLSLVLCGLVCSSWGDKLLTSFLGGQPEWTTSIFGPLDTSAARISLRYALLQGALSCLTAFGVGLLVSKQPKLSGLILLVVGVFELGFWNHSLIYTVPQSLFSDKPHAWKVIEQAELREPASGPFRVHRIPNWAPAAWVNAGSPVRHQEIIDWEWNSVRPKYGINFGLTYTYVVGTTEWIDMVPFFDAFPISLSDETLRGFGLKSGQKINYFTRRGFDLWNTRYFILPARLAVGSPIRGILSFLPETTEIDPPAGALEGPDGEANRKRLLIDEDVQILRNDAAFPRAWIVHRARFNEPITDMSLDARRPLMKEILYQDDELWHIDGRSVYDPRALAWLEVDSKERQSFMKRLSGALPDPEESVTIDRMEPQRVEMTAQLKSAGLVVLADIYYPGWRLTIDGIPAPIHRVNRAMRGAFVGAGSHRLVYEYEPNSVRVGAILTLVGIGLTGLLMFALPFRFTDRLKAVRWILPNRAQPF